MSTRGQKRTSALFDHGIGSYNRMRDVSSLDRTGPYPIRGAPDRRVCLAPQVSTPIDLEAEEIIPLAELVTQRRARADALQREMRDIQVLLNGTVRVLPKPGSNGSDGQGD